MCKFPSVWAVPVLLPPTPVSHRIFRTFLSVFTEVISFLMPQQPPTDTLSLSPSPSFTHTHTHSHVPRQRELGQDTDLSTHTTLYWEQHSHPITETFLLPGQGFLPDSLP